MNRLSDVHLNENNIVIECPVYICMSKITESPKSWAMLYRVVLNNTTNKAAGLFRLLSEIRVDGFWKTWDSIMSPTGLDGYSWKGRWRYLVSIVSALVYQRSITAKTTKSLGQEWA